jgi:hypothetical protein
MPYIKDQLVRKILNEIVESNKAVLTAKGSLNYILHKIAKETCFSYDDYRALFGEIECAKMEIYRRLTAHYEDKKKDEYGDVD